jgi:hypothetical protein
MPTTAPTIQGRMLCASGLCYSIPDSPSSINPPTTVEEKAPYYDGVGYISDPVVIQNGKAACTIGQNSDGIILAFRGTVFFSVEDWFIDFMAFTKTGTNIPGKVHSGFYDEFDSIAEEIYNTILPLMIPAPGQPQLNLIITGHSKGAGMAPIAAYYLFANYQMKASKVFLYAPPNPGDGEFAAAYNTQFPNTESYENFQDIVPLLPPTPPACAVFATNFTDHVKRDLMLAFAALDYTPVGQDSQNIYFIQANYTIELMSLTVRIEQMAAVEFVLKELSDHGFEFVLFIFAHTHKCGHGYMESLCPSVCNSTSTQS